MALGWSFRLSSMNLEDARDLLRLKIAYTEEELQRAWRDAAKAAHPDAGGSDSQMQAVNAARDLLEGTARKARPATSAAEVVLQISPDGALFGSAGNRLGICSSVDEAIKFCRRAGWQYALSKELPVTA